MKQKKNQKQHPDSNALVTPFSLLRLCDCTGHIDIPWIHRYVPSKEHLEWLQVDWGLWAGIGTKFTQGQITPVLIGRYTHEC